MKSQTDLFGSAVGDGQQSLFGEGENRMQPPVQKFTPDPDDVRQELLTLLARARAAQSMPWPEQEARMWQIVFPQMANWLPQEEAEQLRFEFAQEIARLKAA